MENILIGITALMATAIIISAITNKFQKKGKNKQQTFIQEYNAILNNPEFKVKEKY